MSAPLSDTQKSWRTALTKEEAASLDQALSCLAGEAQELDLPLLELLFTGLSTSAGVAQRLGLTPEIPWTEWQRAFEQAKAGLRSYGVQTVLRSRRTGSPFPVSVFPISAFLAEDVGVAGVRFDCLRGLLLGVAATGISEHGEAIRRIAIELRRARGAKPPRGEILAQLPDPWDYESGKTFLVEADARIAAMKEDRGKQVPAARHFLSALSDLIRLAENKSVASGISTGESDPGLRPSAIRVEQDEPEDGRWTPPGDLDLVDVQDFDSDNDTAALGEPTEKLLVYSESRPQLRIKLQEVDSSEELDEAEDLDTDEVNANARLTRYWLSNQQSLVPASRSLLNPLERQALIAGLDEAMAPRRRSSQGPVAATVAMSYFLGLPVERVVTLRIGPNEDLQLSTGRYRRTLLLPPRGFRPGPQDREYLSIPPKVVELQLPRLLCSYLAGLSRKSPVLASFGDVLGIHRDAARELAKDFLERLRDGGRYEIYLERVRASLRNELTAHARSPLAAYLLAGEPGYEPPMLGYYTAIPVTEIQDLYKKVCALLAGQAMPPVHLDS